MICRIWHGRTPRSKAVAYTSFLVKRAKKMVLDVALENLRQRVMAAAQ